MQHFRKNALKATHQSKRTKEFIRANPSFPRYRCLVLMPDGSWATGNMSNGFVTSNTELYSHIREYIQ